MKTYWGSGGIAPRILDLGTRWKWVVSFTPRPLYQQNLMLIRWFKNRSLILAARRRNTHVFSALRVWSTPPPHLTLWIRPSSSHWTGGLVGPRVGLDATEKRKNSHYCPCGELNVGRPAVGDRIQWPYPFDIAFSFVSSHWDVIS
jgi:hypothetical protein